MRRRTFLFGTGTVAVGGVTGLAGCSGGDGGDGGSGDAGDGRNGGDGGGGESQTVRMVSGEAFYFDPIGLLVEPGETVTWRIQSGAHSTTAYTAEEGSPRVPDGADGWDSGTLTEQGATFEHTFEVPGTYDYFCIPHKSLEMVGRVVVDEPGGPAEGTMPPAGRVPESATIVEDGAVPFDSFRRG